MHHRAVGEKHVVGNESPNLGESVEIEKRLNFLRNRTVQVVAALVLLTILILLPFLFFKVGWQQEISTCNATLAKAKYGEWHDVHFEKSEIPIVYYWNGPDLPDWALLSIRNTLKFHSRVYFISQDGKLLDMDGIINVKDTLSLSKEMREKLAEQENEEVKLIHLSELKRTMLHQLMKRYKEEKWIYSDLDVILLKPLYTCDFLSLDWRQFYEEVLIDSALFCLNETILNVIHSWQETEYDSDCFDCMGSPLFSDLYFEHRYTWNVTLKKGVLSPVGKFRWMEKNPLLQQNLDHLHIFANRTVENFNYYLNFTRKREWSPEQSNICAVEKKEW